jgi:hypothetical protein
MDVPGERLNAFDRCRWQDSVSEVEHMARPSFGSSEDIVGGFEHAAQGSEKQGRVQVALYPAVGSNSLPRFV